MQDRDDLFWPEPGELEPTGFATTSDGLTIAYYDLGGVGPDLVLVHATGFCAAVLAPLAAGLGDRFRCWGVDSRAHGLSEHPDVDFDWHGFALDVLAVVEHLGLDSPAGFGHSCGGAALLLAEQAAPGTFGALYCYEPVVVPVDPPLAPSTAANPLSEGALRRRASFSSRADALANFSAKEPFARLRADVLAAYVDNGFEKSADGSLSLRCRREEEARIYALGASHDAFARMTSIACPVTLACGELTDAIGPELLALLGTRLRRHSTEVMADLGHFGPLEDPDTVAASARAHLSGPWT